jgi:hypothetical protein
MMTPLEEIVGLWGLMVMIVLCGISLNYIQCGQWVCP